VPSSADGSNPTPDNSTATPAAGGVSSDSGGAPAELSFMQQLTINPDDDTVTWIPEILALEFRYFDGTAWSSTWSSIDHKSLPVAVEVVVQLAPAVAADPSRPVAPPPATDDGSATAPMNPSSPDSTSSGGPICHLLIHLPAAQLSSAPTLFADDNSNPSGGAATSDDSSDSSSLASTGIMPSDGGLSDPSAEVGADGTLQDALSLQDLNTIIGADQPASADPSASSQGSSWSNPSSSPSDHWMRILQ
jgi:hypothetical protein